MLSSVDLPDPDGPMMATYSFRETFRSIPRRAGMDSTPSVIGLLDVIETDHLNLLLVPQRLTGWRREARAAG